MTFMIFRHLGRVVIWEALDPRDQSLKQTCQTRLYFYFKFDCPFGRESTSPSLS